MVAPRPVGREFFWPRESAVGLEGGGELSVTLAYLWDRSPYLSLAVRDLASRIISAAMSALVRFAAFQPAGRGPGQPAWCNRVQGWEGDGCVEEEAEERLVGGGRGLPTAV